MVGTLHGMTEVPTQHVQEMTWYEITQSSCRRSQRIFVLATPLLQARAEKVLRRRLPVEP